MKLYLKEPGVKEVLIILGVGTFIAASFVFPTLPLAAASAFKMYKNFQGKQAKKLDKFNQARLRQMLKRLYEQKIVDIYEEGEQQIIKLTEKGRTRLIKYNLEELPINHTRWDGKWRLIIYDIHKSKKIFSDLLRRFLKRMACLKLQKSVYLTPYQCKDQIEFLRQFYNLDKEVLYLEISRIEDERVYKKYFGLD